MAHPRKLVLRKETLTELSADSLRSIVGGTGTTLGPSWDCTRQIECINDISFEICPTLPAEVCAASEIGCTFTGGR